MLISHEKRFIFVHVYKTAGTSVRDVFLPHCRLIDRLVYYHPASRRAVNVVTNLFGLQNEGGRHFAGVRKHGTAIDARDYLGRERFGRYFKFAIARNPYDWMVSLYVYIREAKHHRDHPTVQKMTFFDFVQSEVERRAPRQFDFVSDEEGRLIVDFVGRFEHLQDDVEEICRRVGIPRTDITHRNQTRNRAGRDWNSYYDDASRELVGSYFATDFDAFGYDCSQRSSAAQQ